MVQRNGTEDSGRFGQSEKRRQPLKVVPFFSENFRWSQSFHLFSHRNNLGPVARNELVSMVFNAG